MYYRGPAYPYTNFHELNLDWVLQVSGELDKYVEYFSNTTASAVSLPSGTVPFAKVEYVTDAQGVKRLLFRFGLVKGDKGDAATLNIVGTTTLSPEEAARVEETSDSTPSDRKYWLYLPKGDTGTAATFQIAGFNLLPPGSEPNVAELATSTPQNRQYVLEIPSARDGSNFQILGEYDTLDKLKEAHPTGNRGDAWAVGDEENKIIYVWDVDKNDWVSIGAINARSYPFNGISPGDTGYDIKIQDIPSRAGWTPGAMLGWENNGIADGVDVFYRKQIVGVNGHQSYKTLYLSVSGSDDNDGLSNSTPMLTINGALAKYAGSGNVRIYLADGLYEAPQYPLSFCYSLDIIGSSPDRCTIATRGLNIQHGQLILSNVRVANRNESLVNTINISRYGQLTITNSTVANVSGRNAIDISSTGYLFAGEVAFSAVGPKAFTAVYAWYARGVILRSCNIEANFNIGVDALGCNCHVLYTTNNAGVQTRVVGGQIYVAEGY